MYADIHDVCAVKDEVARGLDSYATISKLFIVPKDDTQSSARRWVSMVEK